LKVEEYGKRKDNAETRRTQRFAEKRDGNTEFTEGRTQRSQRKAGKRKANHRVSRGAAEEAETTRARERERKIHHRGHGGHREGDRDVRS